MNPFLSLENRLRRLSDQIGGAVDGWLHKGAPTTPTLRGLSNRLAPLIQKSIDHGLREETGGAKPRAPHRVVVLLDYNTFSQLEQPELRSLKHELEQVAQEHVTNRRYETEARLTLTVTYDPLAAEPSVRADFGLPVATSAAAAPSTSSPLVARSDNPSGKISLRLKSIGSRIAIDAAISRLRPAGTPVTIGRGYDNDIVIDDRSVSKFHATIALSQDGKLIVADVGSTNGTFVNQKKVRGRSMVELGDVITFGEVDVRIEV